MQPYELAAFLDLGRDYDENAELGQTAVTEYREILAAAPEDSMVEQRAVDAARDRIRSARCGRQAADEELHDAVRAADGLLSERDIADAAGLARMTVRKILGR